MYVAETHTGARVLHGLVAGPGEIEHAEPVGRTAALLCGLPGYQLLDSLAVDSAGNVVVGTLVNGGLTVIAPDGSGSVEHVRSARSARHQRLLRR